MVAACIYVKGGARGPDSKVLTIACQKAFHQLLDSMGFKGRKPKPVACGSRGAVHERFVKAHANGTSDYVVEDAWLHLDKVTTVPQWKQPDGADNHQVLFMTTCMETWFVADRGTLRSHCGAQLQDGLCKTRIAAFQRLRLRPAVF
jgi:hypothetical protein